MHMICVSYRRVQCIRLQLLSAVHAAFVIFGPKNCRQFYLKGSQCRHVRTWAHEGVMKDAESSQGSEDLTLELLTEFNQPIAGGLMSIQQRCQNNSRTSRGNMTSSKKLLTCCEVCSVEGVTCARCSIATELDNI